MICVCVNLSSMKTKIRMIFCLNIITNNVKTNSDLT